MMIFTRKPAHAAALLVISLAILAVVYYAVFREPSAPPVRPPVIVFMDEATNEFVKVDPKSIPPMANSAGQETLVGAVLIDEKAPPTVENTKYLYRLTAAAKDTVSRMLEGDPQISVHGVIASKGQGKEVRSPKQGSPWLPANSPEGIALQAK